MKYIYIVNRFTLKEKTEAVIDQGSIGVGGKEFLNPLGMSAWDKYWMLTIG